MEPRTIADLKREPEDTTWVAVAYGSFLAGHLLLALAALVLTRDKSEYARFHALQSLVAHLLAMVVMMLFVGVFFGLFFASMASGMAAAHQHSSEPPMFFFAIFPTMMCFTIGTMFSSVATAFLGISRALSLRDFTMPLIGSWVFRRFFAGKRAPQPAG